MSKIDFGRFPHIDLNELSSRPGVEGSRYVEAPGFKGCLGDTNTGRIVHPETFSVAGYCPQQAEQDEYRAFVNEQVTRDGFA
jgi:hypothetical protein